MAGVVGFALASVLAGAAPTGAVLIAARALQGVAAAFMTTNSLALLRETYGKNAGHAVGLWTAFTSVATLGGPPLGGVLVEWVSWRWIFFINLPLAVAAIVLAHIGRCPPLAEHRVGRLDLPGAALAALAFGMVTFGMVDGASNGFENSWWAFVVAAVAMAAFVVVERRVEEPMLPFSLFRNRNFAVANLETFLVYGARRGVLLLTIYLQFLGFSPFAAGLANVPGSVVMILLSAPFGKLADEHAPLFLTVGPRPGRRRSALHPCQQGRLLARRVPALLVFAFGLAMVVAPISRPRSGRPAKFSGVAAGLNQTFSRLGNLLAVAALGLVVTVVFEANGGSSADVRSRGPGRDDARRPRSTPGGPAWRWSPRSRSPAPRSAAIFISNREARGEQEAVEAATRAPGTAASRNLSPAARVARARDRLVARPARLVDDREPEAARVVGVRAGEVLAPARTRISTPSCGSGASSTQASSKRRSTYADGDAVRRAGVSQRGSSPQASASRAS